MVVIVMTEGTYEQVINELDRLGIKYGMVDHPAAETTEQADKYIEGHEGVRTKTMFLKGKKKHFYLVINRRQAGINGASR